MFNRRQLISHGAVLSAGALVASCSAEKKPNSASSAAGAKELLKEARGEASEGVGEDAGENMSALIPGIQLYTLRDALSESPATVLEALSTMGYKEVELAGLPAELSAPEFRALLDRFGLRCPAMHVQGPIASQAAIAQSVGAELMVLPVPMPLLNEQWQLRANVTLADFRQFAVSLNEMGAEAKRYGLQFGFHNHAWEMLVSEGELAFEVLLTETDPELVFMELDLGWTHVGGVNALDLFERHPGRFKTCHVKDFDSEGNMVNAGEGVVPLEAQLAEHHTAGLQHYFIEHDDSKDALQSAKVGYRFLSELEAP